MNLSTRITSFVDRYQLIPEQSTIIVGLSGGPDSVFLVHYLLMLREARRFAIVIAHLNHGWRSHADHDEQFCRALAEQIGVQCVVGHARDFQAQMPWTGSREEQGRLMRRHFFEQIAQQYSCARIALAHHQDDQYETFFIRLVRGAGLQGLRGMTPQAEQYIRPLLAVRKEEIYEYLHAHNIGFVIDCTNTDSAYLRNRIRHQVIPALRTCDERFPLSFQQTMQHLAEADDFCTSLAEQTLTSLMIIESNERWLDLQKLLALHTFLQKMVILRWLCQEKVPFVASQGFFHEIVRFLQQPQGGTHQLNKKWYVQKRQQKASLRHLQ